MTRLRKAYLPKWLAWMSQLFIAPIWLWVTYRVFFTEVGRDDLGVDGWLMITVIMAVLSVMLFLMGYRKLPTYLIEDED